MVTSGPLFRRAVFLVLIILALCLCVIVAACRNPFTITDTADRDLDRPLPDLGDVEITAMSNYDTRPVWYWTGCEAEGTQVFRYRVNGSDWVVAMDLTPDGDGRFSYSPGYDDEDYYPGTYLFEVQERNTAGNWSETSSQTIRILVQPPVFVNAPGAWTGDTTPYFEWRTADPPQYGNGITGLYSWRMERRTGSSWEVVPEHSAENQAATEYRVTGGLPDGTYRFGVAERNAGGEMSAFFHISSDYMVSVPGGTFVQEDTEGNSFSHTISGFEIARYPVTYELWYTVRVWAFHNEYSFANPGREGNDSVTTGEAPTERKHEPVTEVSWRDAIVWLNAYSEMVGLNPVYYSDAGYSIPIRNSNDDDAVQADPGSIDNPYVLWSADGYRLPTEGEWQYAASYQDGTNWTPYNYASGARADITDVTATGAVAWFFGNSDTGDGRKTHPAGTKAPNQLGISDMSGNVLEYVWDWFGDYPSVPQTNYEGAGGLLRVRRGGSYTNAATFLQVGFRGTLSPWDINDGTGFRLARTSSD